MDINVVVLSGTLVVAPEVIRFDSGKTRMDMLIRIGHQVEGRERIDVLSVSYWDFDESLTKMVRGDRVWVAATIQRRFFSAAVNGQRDSKTQIVASQVTHRVEELDLATVTA